MPAPDVLGINSVEDAHAWLHSIRRGIRSWPRVELPYSRGSSYAKALPIFELERDAVAHATRYFEAPAGTQLLDAAVHAATSRPMRPVAPDQTEHLRDHVREAFATNYAWLFVAFAIGGVATKPNRDDSTPLLGEDELGRVRLATLVQAEQGYALFGYSTSVRLSAYLYFSPAELKFAVDNGLTTPYRVTGKAKRQFEIVAPRARDLLAGRGTRRGDPLFTGFEL